MRDDGVTVKGNTQMNGDDFLNDWASSDNGSTTETNTEIETGNPGGEDGLEAGRVADAGEGGQVDNGDGGNAEAESGTTTDTDHDEGNPVPYAAMKAERLKRQAESERAKVAEARQKDLETQLEALRNPTSRPTEQPPVTTATESAEAPDFWADPVGFVNHQTEQRVNAAVREVQMQSHFRQIEDRQRAVHADFDEVSKLAHQAATRDPQLAQRIMTAADPGAELYAVGKQIKDYQDITANPDAYRERIRQEILAEVGGEEGNESTQAAPTTTRRTVDLSTRRNAKSDNTAAPPDPFNQLFPE